METLNRFVQKSSFSFFAYFASFAVIIPLSGLYLNSVGFTTREIGLILGVSILARVLGPYLFLLMANRSKGLVNTGLAQCLLLLGSLVFGAVSGSKVTITIALALTNLFWISILPNLETITLSYLQGKMQHYSKIRMWGSIGFIFISLWASYVMIRFSADFFWYILIVLVLALMFSIRNIGRFDQFQMETYTGKKFEIEKGLAVYYVVFFLFELSHAPYHGFFSILLLQKGYTGFEVGAAIAFAIICEIVTFAKAAPLLEKWDTKAVLLTCAIAAVARWLMVETFAANLWLVAVSQVLHAFTFAIVHISAMKIMATGANEQTLQSRQTTYTVVTMGLGAAIGAYLAGVLWNTSFLSVTSFTTVGASTGGLIAVIMLLRIATAKQAANKASVEA